MNFNQLIDHIKNSSLTGTKAHEKLAPTNRIIYTEKEIPKNAREAGVLLLLYVDENKQINVLLTKRANYKGTHSGQISFPGGKKESFDFNLQETALRETFEEVGVSSIDVDVIKQLSTIYIPPSNFVVNPYIGVIKKNPVFRKNHEVKELIYFPIHKLFNDKNLGVFKSSTTNTKTPCFIFNDHKIWGATAMILNELKEVLKTL